MANDKELQIKISLKDKIKKPLKKVTGGLKNLAKTALKSVNPLIAVSAAVAGIGAALIKTVAAMADLETKMVNVGNLTGASREEVNAMTDDLVELSREVPQSVGNLAESLFDVVSAGVPAGESIEFLNTASRLATAGVTDTKTAVDGLTSVMNAFSMEASEASDISDKFFAAQQKGKTTIAELSSSIGQVAPIAAGMGVSFDELIASMSTLTLNGIKTAEATTGLKATLSNLLKPTEQAKDVASALGIEFDANAVQSKGLTNVLKDVIDKTGGSKTAMGQLFGSMEAVNAVLALSNENFAALDEVQQAVEESTGATNKAFEENINTLSAQWKIIKNNTFSLGKTLLGWLIPALTTTLKAFNKLYDGINKGFRVVSRATRKFTNLFRKESEKVTQTEKEEQQERTTFNEEEEAKRFEALANAKAAEVDLIVKNIKKVKEEEKKAREEKAKAEEKARKAKEKADKKQFENEEKARKEAHKKEQDLLKEKAQGFQDISNQIMENEGDFVKVMGNFIKKYLKDELNAFISMEQAKLGVIAAVNWWNPLGWEAGAKVAVLEGLKQAGFAAIDSVKFNQGGVIPSDRGTIGDRTQMQGMRFNGGELVSNREQQANILHHMAKNRGATLPPTAGGGSNSSMNGARVILNVDGKKMAEAFVTSYNKSTQLQLIPKLRV